MGFPDVSMIKNLSANSGDSHSTPESVRDPREGNDNPLQYSCLRNPMAEEPDGLQSMRLQKTRT